MIPPRSIGKLTGFAAALAVAFVLALLAGDAFGPEPGDQPAAAAHEEDEMHAASTTESSAPAESAAAPGLAVSAGGLALELERSELRRGRREQLRFRVADADGRAVDDFEVEHTKRMHVIVVRRDGTGFQHVHPELGDGGTWSVPVTIAEAGSYRVFADFTREGEAHTLAADLHVDGDARYRQLPDPDPVATVDGYEVALDHDGTRAGHDATLRFTVTRGGDAVHTEPYLGAGGHLVALRDRDLAYLHVHPGGHGDEAGGDNGEEAGHDDAIAFTTAFPTAARYRLYLQFKHDGRVHTAEFSEDVAP